MRNIKIHNKLTILILSFLICAGIIISISVYSLRNISNTNKYSVEGTTMPLSYLVDIAKNFENSRVEVYRLIFETDMNVMKNTLTQILSDLDIIHKDIDAYKQVMLDVQRDFPTQDSEQNAQIIAVLDDLYLNLSDYKDVIAEGISQASLENDHIFEVLSFDDGMAAAQVIERNVNYLIEINQEKAADFLVNTGSITTNTMVLLLIVFVIAMVVMIVICVAITRSITKPVKKLVSAAEKIANGDFNVSLACNERDEIGKLSRDFENVVFTFKNIMDDVLELTKQHAAGDIDYVINVSKYNGIYKEYVQSVNSLVSSYAMEMIDILGCVKSIGIGEFSIELTQFPGKKAIANEAVGSLKDNLQQIISEIDDLSNSFYNGKLSARMNIDHFEGDWKGTLHKMNKMLDTLIAPMQEAQSVLEEVANGDLSVKVKGDYKGDHAIIKVAVNTTIEFLSEYIEEMTSTLSLMADGNYDIEITREYIGDFKKIKDSINRILDTLNNFFTDVRMATDQVAAGARQISETSVSLSEGASEQASAVEELNATIEQIQLQTKKNETSAISALEQANSTKNNAVRGNQAMVQMLDAMHVINESSNNISKIIKVISDIAFQTNLLALNAAVEAARAGQYGKGFAVVAEEVRNLAVRSQDAAKETTALIESSIDKVNSGTKIANKTANALDKMVEGVSNVSEIMSDIAAASKEQTSSITQISNGIIQISDVTQANSATAEESAAAAHELSRQSDLLSETFADFKIKQIEYSVPMEKQDDGMEKMWFEKIEDLPSEAAVLQTNGLQTVQDSFSINPTEGSQLSENTLLNESFDLGPLPEIDSPKFDSDNYGKY